VNKPPKTITTSEEVKLLRHIQYEFKNTWEPRRAHRNYTIALCMLDAGLRVGEAAKLRISQLYYAESPRGMIDLTAEQTKSKRPRSIPVTARLFQAIEKMNTFYWDDDEAPTVHYAFYVRDPHRPLTIRTIQRIIERNSLASIGRRINPHVLRHTFGTRLMRTCPARVVQQLLGHSSLQTTQIYQHPNRDDLQTAIDTLNSPPSSQ